MGFLAFRQLAHVTLQEADSDAICRTHSLGTLGTRFLPFSGDKQQN